MTPATVARPTAMDHGWRQADSAARASRREPGTLVFDPWFLAAAGVLLGIVVGDGAGSDAAIPGAFALVAGSVLLLLARAHAHPQAGLRVALMVACVAVGALRVATIPRAITGLEPGLLIRVEGTLVRAPTPAPIDAPGAQGGRRTPRVRRLVLSDARIDAGLGERAIDGDVHWLVQDLPKGLRAGARLRASGLVRAVGGPRNPGQRDARADLRRAGVVLVVEVDEPRALTIVRDAAPLSPSAWLEATREYFVAHLRSVLSPRAAGLAAALLVDVRDDLAEHDEDALLATGLIHLIAISGFHIVLLVGAARGALSLVCPPRATDLGAIAFALLYAGLAGAGAPVVRSAVGFSIARLCALASRTTPALAPVAIAAIVLALCDPADVFRPGFQLSFAAVLGLVTMPAADRRRSTRLGRFVEPALFALRTSVRASLWTLPFLVFHFGRVAPWSPLLTVVLTPWFVMAFALAALELPQFALGGGLAPVHSACSWMLERFADLVVAAAGLPHAIVELPRERVAPFALGLAALVCWMERRTRIALGIGVVTWFVAVAPSTDVVGLEAHVFDVGHGQALLVRAEQRPTVLIDAGALGRDDCGERLLLPALDALHVTSIDLLVLTHGDADHINGAASLVRAGRVARLVHGPGFARTPTARAVLDAARAHGVPIDVAGAGTRIVDTDELRIDVLAPAGDDAQRSSNDTSLVLRIVHRAGSILVAGDIETAGIDALLATTAALRSDVLVLPHHGQREPRLGILLERVAPRLALASRRGPLPRGEGIRLARRVGAELWSTSEHGAIRLRFIPQGAAAPGLRRSRAELSGWSSNEVLELELPGRE
ncbi:MAG: ComEC/Rec2 family competence protein [Planctomycetes bacterium]|nr:ComEC/Rec2 family competence protein [Planctomycetota bacterium]MCC7170888.1 ComEC/Rec2 family competence protein [Planctomycetota bacterium]